MTPGRRLRAGLALLLFITLAGSAGFMIVEELNLFDAVYMTVITVSTVGFREVGGELSAGGQTLTILLILLGTGTALYTAATALELGLETFLGGQRERKRMIRDLSLIADHTILCGFGRVGRQVGIQLRDQDAPVVVIDSEPEAIAAALEIGALIVDGDATSDEALIQAGIDRARVLIAAVQSDSDNLVIVLSAKARRPDLLVLARASASESQRKLYLAGADRVVAPQLVGANRLAGLALQPDLADFIDLVVSGRLVQFRVVELDVVDGAEIVGRSLREIDLRRQSGALVLAVDDGLGKLTLNPDPGLVIRPGQTLIGVGTEEQLDVLRRLAGRP
jgi:voltage-gated potassium channel